jgi:hypothetical protein
LVRLSPCRFSAGNDRTSHVPEEPPVHLPCSPTPVGPTPPGHNGDASAAPADSKTRAPTRKLSRLNHTASALAVYASPGLLPPPTQDSLRLPARLYRTGFEPAGSYERFLSVYPTSLSPFSSTACLAGLSWRKESFSAKRLSMWQNRQPKKTPDPVERPGGNGLTLRDPATPGLGAAG